MHAKETYAPLFKLADVIKIDIMGMSRPVLVRLVNDLRAYGKQLLAEKVETLEQYKFCKQLGFDLFQGYYFAKPTIIVGKKLNPSQLVLMRLMGLMMQDADTLDLEEAFKLEPGLTLNLLRLTNSASNGLSVKVTSLAHAITVLGRDQLRRWIQLLIYTSSKTAGQGDNPVMPLAATRGRMMELLGSKIHPGSRVFSDQSFMVGIMSLMPVVLNVSMDSIIAQLPVSQSVKDALGIARSGELGQLLKLVEATEKNSPQALTVARAAFPMLSGNALQECLIQAFSWGNHIAQDKGR